MARNNHNAGMHFVRYRNSIDPFEYDRYADYVREQIVKKYNKDLKGDDAPAADFLEEYRKEKQKKVSVKKRYLNDSMECVFEDACYCVNKLYVCLYAMALKNHCKLNAISTQITDYLKEKSRDGSIDDMLFINMAARMIGCNLGQLWSLTDYDIQRIVYGTVFSTVDWKDNWRSVIDEDGNKCIEGTVILDDYSNEELVRSCYLDMREAIKKDKVDLLPDIKAHYDVSIVKEEQDEVKYTVLVSVGFYKEPLKEHYLSGFEIEIYSESIGYIEEFFEDHYSESE